VPLVLLFPGNAQDYCFGRIGRDKVFLLQKGLCDVANHERQKVEVKEPVMHIVTPATKQTKFAAYETRLWPLTSSRTCSMLTSSESSIL
jgi:hypothetical protein